MVKVCDIRYLASHARNESTVAFAIVRSLSRPIDGVTQLDVLSPSKSLFYAYCGWKDAGQWNAAKFQDAYVPRFLSEIRNDKAAHLALKDIWERDRNGETVLLGCFCPDEALCHRSIIAGLLTGIGVKVETDTGSDYIGYYRQYRQLPKPSFAA